MTIQITTGSTLMCTGCPMGPSTLNVVPLNKAMAGKLPAANIMDHKPFVNILPFPVCMSPGNPAFVAATSAAMGVPTPVPCTPMTFAPWVPGSPKVLINKMPALNLTSKCICSFAGVISIVKPGQMKAMIP